MLSFFRARRRLFLAYTLLIIAGGFAKGAFAQAFRSDPIDEKLKGGSLKAKRWTGDSAFYTTDKAAFDDYFQKYFLPTMTRSGPNELGELGKLRVDLFKKYLWATPNESLQSDLTKMAYDWSLRVLRPSPVAGDPSYHPAVRYNAVLILGSLDDQYAIEGGASPRPPVPSATANKALTAIVDRAAGSNLFPPYVVHGAILGLERHAKYRDSLAPGATDSMTAALLKIVALEKPIQDMDPAAFSWMQLRAAATLAELRSLGPQNSVHNAIIKLIANSKNLDDRCAAAALLGKFKYDGAKIDPKTTTDGLFKLAHDLAADEGKRAADFEKAQLSGGAMATGRLARVAQNDPNAELNPYPRRQILARLDQLRKGLRAVKVGMPEDAKKKIESLEAAIKPVIDATSDPDTVSLKIAETVRIMAQTINGLAPEDKAATDSDEFTSAAAPAADAAKAPVNAARAAATPPAANGAPEKTPAAAIPAAAPAPTNTAPPADQPPAAAVPTAPAAGATN